MEHSFLHVFDMLEVQPPPSRWQVPAWGSMGQHGPAWANMGKVDMLPVARGSAWQPPIYIYIYIYIYICVTLCGISVRGHAS